MNEERQKVLKQRYFELQVLEHQIKEVQQQRQIFNYNLQELIKLTDSLSDLANVNEGKDVLAQLGPRVFIKTELRDNKLVLVDVGANVIVEKTIDEAKSFISTQLKELEENIYSINRYLVDAVQETKKAQNEVIELQKDS